MMDYRNNYNNENETNNENMMAAEQNSFNGKKPSSKNKKAAKLAKKIGAIALSAVLFGGVAGGTFQAVNHFAVPCNTISNQSANFPRVVDLQTLCLFQSRSFRIITRRLLWN